jgi:sporulation protein YlmC with PRC-barrel domain
VRQIIFLSLHAKSKLFMHAMFVSAFAAAAMLAAPTLAQMAVDTPAAPPAADQEPANQPDTPETRSPAATAMPDQTAAEMADASIFETTSMAGASSGSQLPDRRGEEIAGKTLYGTSGEEIGEIDDVVLSREDRQLAAVVGVGGFLGIGERKVTIPLDQLQIGAEDRLTTSMTKESIGALQSHEESGYQPMERNRTIAEGMNAQ